MIRKYRIVLLAVTIIIVTAIATAYLMPLLKYNQASTLASQEQYDEAINLYSELKDYKDSKEQIQKIKDKIHEKALQYYHDGEFLLAKELFKSIEDYSDSKEYLTIISEIKRYIGTWSNNNKNASKETWQIFDKWTNYDVLHPTRSLFFIDHQITFNRETSQLEVEFPAATIYFYIDKNGYLIREHKFFNDTNKNTIEKYQKISESTELPKGMQDPQIGMTASEVENSTWGSPQKINKTTTAYGVSEQWVYRGYKYIYLDNGIVTAIQE